MTRRILFALLAMVLGVTILSADTMATPPTQPTIGDIVTREVARLTILLTLTSDQQARATTIFTTKETALAGFATSQQTAQTALETAIKANNAANIQTQAAAIGTLEGQRVLAQATAQAAFYVILTTDQQTKYDTYQLAGLDGPPRGFGGGHGPGH